MKQILGDLLTDGLALAGAGLVAYGSWLAWPPAGYIVGGLALIAWGIVRGAAYERLG